MKKRALLIIGLMSFFVFFIQSINAQTKDISQKGVRSAKQAWVDSVYNSLNEEERIGQLFMVAAYSDSENYNEDQILKLIKAHQIGGLIFMQGTPEKQAELTNEYQKKAQVPLLIGMDGEWGLGMRLTGVQDFPRQMLLGATRDPGLVGEMGAAIADQCKRLGVQIDFAPDVDVNNNPKNPIINSRSFGQDKKWVALLGMVYMEGLQHNGVMACAKHFPGHGDVTVDSHKDLPVINKSLREIDTLELFPFRKMIQAGVKCIMVAHLDVPALDSTPHLPTTLSRKVVTDLLKKRMGFQGLVITDALNMKGVTKYFPDGEADLMAFLAGNDILLFSQNVPLAIQKIEEAIKEGKASNQDLENSVKKILSAKYDAGLNHFQLISQKNILSDLNKNINKIWRRAADESITLVKDESGLLDKINVHNAKIAYWNINTSDTFRSDMSKLMGVRFSNPKIPELSDIDSVKDYDVVVVGIHDTHLYPGSNDQYGLTDAQITLIQKLAQKKNVCFLVFGNAYLMKYLCNAGTVLEAYQESPFTEQAAVNVLSGKLIPQGKLSVIACP